MKWASNILSQLHVHPFWFSDNLEWNCFFFSEFSYFIHWNALIIMHDWVWCVLNFKRDQLFLIVWLWPWVKSHLCNKLSFFIIKYPYSIFLTRESNWFEHVFISDWMFWIMACLSIGYRSVLALEFDWFIIRFEPFLLAIPLNEMCHLWVYYFFSSSDFIFNFVSCIFCFSSATVEFAIFSSSTWGEGGAVKHAQI